jgi:transcriptional regulator with XRE-family HTH domain
MATKFSEQLRRARIAAGITQTELAAKVGVTPLAVSNWESGKIAPKGESRELLRKVLGPFDSDTAASTAQTTQGPTPFGVWLNRQRVAEGLSVAELSAKSQLSVPAIYNIESGRIASPRPETVRKLEKALGRELPEDAREEIREEAKIEGFGEFLDFDPYNDDDRPASGGIYVLYDVSDRPIYVGQGGDIRRRIRDHNEKFWFRSPIVQTGSYVTIEDKGLREKVEKLLIRFLKSNAVINKQNVDR